MNKVTCDRPGCGAQRPSDDVTPHDWLSLEQPSAWRLETARWDFCSWGCLAVFSQDRLTVAP